MAESIATRKGRQPQHRDFRVSEVVFEASAYGQCDGRGHRAVSQKSMNRLAMTSGQTDLGENSRSYQPDKGQQSRQAPLRRDLQEVIMQVTIPGRRHVGIRAVTIKLVLHAIRTNA